MRREILSVVSAPRCPATAPDLTVPLRFTLRPSSPVTVSTPVAPGTKPMPKKATDQAVEYGFLTVQKRKRRQQSTKNCSGTGL